MARTTAIENVNAKHLLNVTFFQIVRFNRHVIDANEDILTEAFFPPFEAVKVRLEVGFGIKCMKTELYVYDAGLFPFYLFSFIYSFIHSFFLELSSIIVPRIESQKTILRINNATMNGHK